MGLVLLIPPLIVLTLVVTLGYTAIARSTSTAFTSWLKDASVVGRYIGGITAELAIKLTRWITRSIGAEWADLERLGVAWFSGLYQWAALAVTNALEWPVYLWRFQNWLLFVELPKLYRAVPIPTVPSFPNIWKRLRAIEQALAKLGKLAGAGLAGLIAAGVWKYIRPYWHALQWLRANFHALTHVIPRALPVPVFPSLKGILKRLRALEKKAALGVGIAAVAAALARMGIGFIRCGNVKRVGKSLCGLDSNLLSSLLLDGLAIFSILSVVEFAKELRTVEDEAVAIMGRLVREWPA